MYTFKEKGLGYPPFINDKTKTLLVNVDAIFLGSNLTFFLLHQAVFLPSFFCFQMQYSFSYL